jgi:hypothetical protein
MKTTIITKKEFRELRAVRVLSTSGKEPDHILALKD